MLALVQSKSKDLQINDQYRGIIDQYRIAIQQRNIHGMKGIKMSGDNKTNQLQFETIVTNLDNAI